EPTYYYKFIPETISVFDITEIATGNKIEVSNYEDGFSNNDYKIECYDNTGTSIYTKEFNSVSPYEYYNPASDWPEESSFCATFDIPENTKTLKMFDKVGQMVGWYVVYVWNTEPIFQLTYTSTPEINITSLTSGIKLSDSVEISWIPETTKQIGETMQYVVMVSPDGGKTWMPTGLPTTSTSLTIPTDFLPASNNIVFKVIGNSGLGPTTSDEIGGLEIENRAPKAIIESPEDGSIGEQETKWVLKGYGIDNEDGTIATGEWTSSLDGQLDTEADIILTPGTHTITFKVTDSGGLTDESSVVVEVKEEVDKIDLSLNEESLTLLIPGRDPLNTSSIVWLEKGKEHRAILKIKNTGIDTIFNASVSLKRPQGTEEELQSGYFAAGPFEEVVLSETFIVEDEGQYQIKGVITDTTPEDTNTSNNKWIWTYQTQPNNPIIEVLPEELDFGSVTKRTNGTIIIRNHGNANLEITSLTITGSNEFSVDKGIINTSIPEGNSVIVPIYFDPRTIGEKVAKLEITSNDQGKPTTEITLKGECLQVSGITGDINGDNSVDISDVILCLRMAIGLPIT
ncbi:MAG TPA: choice-of-anchor D domain-containing protein, partial [Candidatus Ratteibacteria bacterium]|nr:choice-of-anchor D domain-containing protein [Candidatus Ratteibacteria bacterium]